MKKIDKEKIKTWFITGASSGIGKELCIQLLEKGYNVIAVSRHIPNISHKNTLCLSVDVTDIDSIQKAIKLGIERFSKIDVLFNNAGISSYLTIEEENIEVMKEVINTNYWGTFNTMRCLIPHFRENKNGTIINNSSACGIFFRAFGAAYCSSKHAIEGLTSTAWWELQNFCRVMCVELSYFKGTDIGKDKKKNTIYPEYKNLEMTPITNKIKTYPNDFKKAVSIIIEEAEKKNIQRRLMLGYDIEYKIKYEINSLKNSLKESLKRARSCKGKMNQNQNQNQNKDNEVIKNNIAILNFHWENVNFGAILTSFALNYFLNNNGFNAQNIDYIPHLTWIRKEKRNKYFDKFREKYLPTTKSYSEIQSLYELNELNNNYQHFIVGSDQVWRYDFIKNDIETYFLSFADKSKNIIACSVSFGSNIDNNILKSHYQLFVNYIKTFNSIGMRERSGIDFCQKNNINAVQTMDPVFYIDSDSWKKLYRSYINKYTPNDIIFYTIHNSFPKDIKNWINNNNKLFKNKSSRNITDNTSIEEWLYQINYSKLFITDSFHGICFAIIFNKEFIFINKDSTTVNRVENILNLLGIKNRLFNNLNEINIEYLQNNPINYNEVNKKLDTESSFSKSWLISSIRDAKINEEQKQIKKDIVKNIEYKIAQKSIIKSFIKYAKYKLKTKYLQTNEDTQIKYKINRFLYKKMKSAIKKR